MPRIDGEGIRRILVIQFRPLGDVLLATSYLGALRKRFPHARIDFLVSAPFDGALRRHPHLDDIIISPAGGRLSYLWGRLRTIVRVRARRYDIVIDQQNGTGSGIATLLSGAPYRVGWADGKWRIAHDVHAVPAGRSTYSASRNFQLVQPLGVVPEPYRLHYAIEQSSRDYVDAWLSERSLAGGDFVCLSPGGPVVQRVWRAENYAALADLILQRTSYRVVLLWGPREGGTVDRVASLMARQPLIAPATSLNQAAALLQKAVVLVCNNGGMNHLSVAIGVPSVAVFGGSFPIHWSPQGIFAGHYHVAREGWQDTADNTFGISPEQAFQTLTQAIRATRAGPMDMYAKW